MVSSRLALASLGLLAGCSNGEDLHNAPRFHIVPRPYGWVNDPNGMWYDPKEKLYHIMYQYNTPRIWGHAVSANMVDWEYLPPSLNNNQKYDVGGVFTGSSWVLDDGTPYLIYSVQLNNAFAVAIPDPDHPTPKYKFWTKPAANPIIKDVEGRDPSTPWKSGDGKSWYFVTAGTRSTTVEIYQSETLDPFSKYTSRGSFFDDSHKPAECPDFFALKDGEAGATHVLKYSADGVDYYRVGSFDEANHSFVPAEGSARQLLDTGIKGGPYASKSFYDPASKANVNLHWSLEEHPMDSHGLPNGFSGTLTLPRIVAKDPADKNSVAQSLPDYIVQALRIADTHQTSTFSFSESPVPLPIKCADNGLVCGAQVEMKLKIKVQDVGVASECGIQLLQNGDQYASIKVAVGSRSTYLEQSKLTMTTERISGKNYFSNVPTKDHCQGLLAPYDAWSYSELDRSCHLFTREEARSLTVEEHEAGHHCGFADGNVLTIVGDGTKLPQKSASYQTPIKYNLESDGSTNVELDIFLDQSIAEVFVNGREVHTRRFFPAPAVNNKYDTFVVSNNKNCVVESSETWSLRASTVV